TQAGGRAQLVQGDVSSVADIQRFVDTTVQAFGWREVLVNHDGMQTRTSLLDTTEQQFDLVIGIESKSAFFGTQCAARQMIKQESGGGRLSTLSSAHEDWPMPGNEDWPMPGTSASCSAQAGVRRLTCTAGVELAPYGSTVVNVGPGAVTTPLAATPQQTAKRDNAMPLGHVADPA